MSNFTDNDYLKNEQYKDSSNLSARIQIHQLYSTNPYNMHLWSFDQLLQYAPDSAKILGLGCGRGDLWKMNEDRVPETWNVTLSDFSSGMLEDAKQNLGVVDYAFQIIDAQEIPFEDNTFDIVTAHFMLYHVPDKAKAIAEIRRVLKPDGVLLAITLGSNHMRELYELANRISPNIFPDHGATSYSFSLENGGEWLKTSFKDISISSYECDLKVTDVQPMIAYVESMNELGRPLSVDERNKLNGFAQELIDKDGFIHISKEVGMFIAQGGA